MSSYGLSAAGANSRRILLVALVLGVAVSPAWSQDRLSRTVALVESLFPVAVVAANGLDDPVDAAFLGGSFALHTLPNVLLLLFESTGNARATSLMRWISAGAGFATATAGIVIGVPLLFGAFPGWDIEQYAGSLIAISIPTGFAAAVDLVPYSIESGPE